MTTDSSTSTQYSFGTGGWTGPRQLEREIDNSPIRVSYVITTRNRCEYLRRALANVREFIGVEDELIIVDGGSTDATAQVVFENRDIVTVFVSEPDTSEGHALNKALFLARGRFIKPITDDDYFYPDAMRHLVATAEAQPEVEAILTGGERWMVIDGELRFWGFSRLFGNPSQIDIFRMHIGLGLLVRRRTLFRTGGISPSYQGVDGDWHCKLVEAGCRVRYLDVNLYRWTKYLHSGAMARDEMEFGYLRFALRLGQWNKLYTTDPLFVARMTGIDKMSGGLGFQYLTFCAHRLLQSRAEPLLRPIPLIVKLLKTLKRVFARFAGSAPPQTTPDFKPNDAFAVFTGKLL